MPISLVSVSKNGWRTTIRLIGILVCSVALGGCWLLEPGYDTAAVGWTCWTLVIALATRNTIRSSLFSWCLAGGVSLSTAFYWVPGAVSENYGVSIPVAALFFAVMIGFESLSWMILGTVCFNAVRRETIPLWCVPSTAVIIDSFWPRIFPWSMGHLQAGAPVFVQVADIGGVPLLTWLMSAGSCAAVWCFSRYLFGNANSISPFGGASSGTQSRFIACVVVMLICEVVYGVRSSSSWRIFSDQLDSVRVAAVQVNSSQANAELRLRDLSVSISPTPQLVIWPESSLGIYSESLRDFGDEDRVYNLSREPHCALPNYAVPGSMLLACGATYAVDAPADGPYRNTSFLINQQQTIVGRYEKRSLLPWGEYVPGQSWIPGLRHLANIDGLRETGRESRPLETESGLKIGAMICYDDVLPGNARESAYQGAEILTVQINAADYSNPAVLRQHCLLSRLRAVENRRYFVRCASTGLTCIISPWGEIIASCGLQSEGIVTGDVRPVSYRTLYATLGDWPVAISLGACVCLVLARYCSRKV